MFKTKTYEDIREHEAFRFEGPEEMEHVYDREGNFYARAHERNAKGVEETGDAGDERRDAGTFMTVRLSDDGNTIIAHDEDE